MLRPLLEWWPLLTNLHVYQNCINFGKHKHILKKASIGKSVTVNALINLNTLDWPMNVPKNTAYLH